MILHYSYIFFFLFLIDTIEILPLLCYNTKIKVSFKEVSMYISYSILKEAVAK